MAVRRDKERTTKEKTAKHQDGRADPPLLVEREPLAQVVQRIGNDRESHNAGLPSTCYALIAGFWRKRFVLNAFRLVIASAISSATG